MIHVNKICVFQTFFRKETIFNLIIIIIFDFRLNIVFLVCILGFLAVQKCVKIAFCVLRITELLGISRDKKPSRDVRLLSVEPFTNKIFCTQIFNLIYMSGFVHLLIYFQYRFTERMILLFSFTILLLHTSGAGGK